MARDPGNRRNQARSIAIAAAPKQFRDSIGGRDQADFLRFRLGQRSSTNFTLSRLQANADLALLNARGGVIRQSRRNGTRNEQIRVALDSGTYFLRITPRTARDSTRYQLQYSATAIAPPPPPPPSNTNPVISAASVAISRGTPAILNSSLFSATDAEQAVSQLVYTLNSLPQSGSLLFDGQAIAPGRTFTQADITAGRLSYANLGGTRQLTDSTTTNRNPVISSSNIAWEGTGGSGNSSDFEIFLLDGSGTRTQITNNSTDDVNPQISGTNLVWQSISSLGSDIFFRGSGTPIRLSTTSRDNTNPQISGTNVIWQGRGGRDGGNDNEMFLWNGNRVIQLTENDTEDVNGQISGTNVVWQGEGGSDRGADSEIFFFNGSTTRQLTANSTDDLLPQISGTNIVWQGGQDGNFEIFFSNGSTNPPTRLTTNATNDFNPQISGTNIVWQNASGSNSTIFFLAIGGNPVLLSASSGSAVNPQVSGSNIVWQANSGGNLGLFYSNGSSNPIALTNNSTNNFTPNLSGANVVWSSTANSGSNAQIFLTNAARQDSFNFTVTDGVGGSTPGTFTVSIA